MSVASLNLSRRMARVLFSACERDSPAITWMPVGRLRQADHAAGFVAFLPAGTGTPKGFEAAIGKENLFFQVEPMNRR